MTFAKFAAGISAGVLGIAIATATIAAESKSEISVMMNMARILRLPSAASTIVIGNPIIADATIQDPRTLVLTGKGYGSTNLIALDAVGNPIADLIINVSADGANLVTVFQGSAKTSISCAPNCQPMALGGDHPDYVKDIVDSLNTATSVNSGN
ncbi:pilus assembly protein N-terminal domain-containing protein [Maritalea sp.]|jgi:Flp pilus assembly secretin CpaC|uniref:pilus assembly protein N-terminal domain-containing protein n=1 Tax=Maritalea sp. TaxID=2003361 RepID=UPI0039E60B2D